MSVCVFVRAGWRREVVEPGRAAGNFEVADAGAAHSCRGNSLNKASTRGGASTLHTPLARCLFILKLSQFRGSSRTRWQNAVFIN